MSLLSVVRRCAAAFAVSVLLAVPWAQAQDAPDFDTWATMATRAESSMESAKASDDALESLRSSLAEWRGKFLAAQGLNKDRISTLQAQIAALGPAPNPESDPEPEPADVAQRRAELNDQLARLRAPVLASEEAYSRADGLIREIDNLIRERRTDRLLEVGPSPLNPARWGVAATSISRSFSDMSNEAQRALSSDVEFRKFRNSLPLVLVLAGIGLLFILRARRWATWLVTYLRQGRRRGARVWSFVVSLGQILLPMLGLILLAQAMQLTGVIGPRLDPVVSKISGWGALILMGWWLGEQVFSRNQDDAIIQLEGRRLTQARLFTWTLTLCLMLHDVIRTFSDAGSYTDTTSYVIDFPVLLLTALALFRLGKILVQLAPPPATGDSEDEKAFGRRLAWLIGRAMMVVALIGPALSAVGYGAAGAALVYPAASSVFLFGLLSVLQRLIYDVYDLATRNRTVDQAGLVPVLAGFALNFCALPFLALIWGARESDLTEMWARFLEGFAIGDTRISPTDFLTFAIIFGIGYAATRLLQSALRTSVLPRTRIDAGGQTAILSGLGYVGICAAAVIAITSAGIDLTALGYVAGALSVGIGFGLQNIVSNFVSGIILLIERPISRGDWVEVGGHMGYVRDISVRSTRIETFDRTDVIVPNSDFISGTVTNYTHGNTIGRVIVPVGVAYGTDTRRVEAILGEIAGKHPMILGNPPPSILFRGFGADSLDFEIRAILRDVNWSLSVHSDLNHEIAERFKAEDIEIPFAQRDVWLRNPETLRNGDPKTTVVAPPSAPPATGVPDSPEDNA